MAVQPLTKLTFALTFFFLALLFTDFRYQLALLLPVVIIYLGSGQRKLLYLYTPKLAVFGFILMLMQILFINEGEPLFFLIPFFNLLPVTKEGLFFGAAMALRMTNIVLSFAYFIATTPPDKIVSLLTGWLRLPSTTVHMFVTALRFLPVFSRELRNIYEIQVTRGVDLECRNPLKRFKAYVPLTVPLVIIALKKAETIAIGMEVRGLMHPSRRSFTGRDLLLTTTDYIALVALAGGLAGGIYLRLHGYGTL